MTTEHAIQFLLHPPLILTQRWAPTDPWRLIHAQCHLRQKVNICQREPHSITRCIMATFYSSVFL